MKYLCLKNQHYFLPSLPRLYWKKKVYHWEVIFNENCTYDLKSDDQLDWNKLVGVSQHFNPRLNSLRFVWRYNLETKLIEIGVYSEKNYVFEYKLLTTVKPTEKLNLTMYFQGSTALLIANTQVQLVPYILDKNITIRCNPYFGGNRTAPHCMTLSLKKSS